MTNRIGGPRRLLHLGLICLLVSPAGAQNPAPPEPNRVPTISYSEGRLGAYKPGTVSQPAARNSLRIHDLMRAGQIYLSLDDAIALALENNLDLELERYGVLMASTDTLRAKGGGLLRGIPLVANEAPAGIGGPGSPLVTTAASGSIAQTTIPTVVTDTSQVNESQDNLQTTGTFNLSSGPNIPQFDPSINAAFQAEHVTTPETNVVTTGTPALVTNAVSETAGYSQGFGPGTAVSAGFQNLRTDTNSLRNLINPYYTSSFGVTVTQPLMRGFGIDLNRRFIHIAQNTERLSQNVFRYQASITVAGVIRLYTDLVSLNEDLHVKRETLTTAERLAEDNRSKVDQGTLAPVELTRAQAQVAAARQDLINADGFVREQELILKSVLTRDLTTDRLVHDARIIPTDALVLDPAPPQTSEELVQVALQYRPDYLAAKAELVNTEIALKGSRNELRPELDLSGTISSNGLAGGPNSLYVVTPGSAAPNSGSLLGGDGSALAQILRHDYPSYVIGLNLTLPIHNRQAQADLARDELQLRQTQVRNKQLENQIRVQVEDALISLERTRAAWEAAVETRKLQEQSLEIEQERFDVGLSTNFLVIQYQSYVSQARSSEVAARGAYAKARSQLDSVMGIILRTHNITLDEALKGQITRVSTPAIPAAQP